MGDSILFIAVYILAALPLAVLGDLVMGIFRSDV